MLLIVASPRLIRNGFCDREVGCTLGVTPIDYVIGRTVGPQLRTLHACGEAGWITGMQNSGEGMTKALVSALCVLTEYSVIG